MKSLVGASVTNKASGARGGDRGAARCIADRPHPTPCPGVRGPGAVSPDRGGARDAPVARLPTRIAEAARNATGEWRASLLAKADFPETHMAIGGAALVLRNPRAAENAFRETVRLDPQRVEAWVMIVRILAATGDLDGARVALDDALAANPSSEALRSLRGGG